MYHMYISGKGRMKRNCALSMDFVCIREVSTTPNADGVHSAGIALITHWVLTEFPEFKDIKIEHISYHHA